MIGEDMTPAESAEYFQAHKHDESEWEEAPPPKVRRKKTPLTVNLSVRFSSAEAVAIQREADRLGLTSSELVRRAVSHLVRPVFLGDEPGTAATSSP
jgi:hypothetical protein